MSRTARLLSAPGARLLALAAGPALVVGALWFGPAVEAIPPVEAREPADDKGRSKEYSLKAAFLFNFLKYTTWPKDAFADDDDPIVLGVVGRDPFGPLLDKVLNKKRIGSRAIAVQRFEKVADVQGVHALFLGTLSPEQRANLHGRLAKSPVLTVGDSKGLAGQDTCVASFYLADGKVRFEISTKAITRARLSISSQLLKLADVVEKRK